MDKKNTSNGNYSNDSMSYEEMLRRKKEQEANKKSSSKDKADKSK